MGLDYGASRIVETGRSRTITYQKFTHPVTMRGACPRCGKRRSRSTTFTMTQNPWNKDPETGLPRTSAQIKQALVAECAAWVPDFTCSSDCTPRSAVA